MDNSEAITSLQDRVERLENENKHIRVLLTEFLKAKEAKVSEEEVIINIILVSGYFLFCL